MEVLTTLCLWVVGIPACSNSTEHTHILYALMRIEDKTIAESLEKSEIGVCLVWLLEDIVELYLLLVSIHKLTNTIIDFFQTERIILV